MKRILLLIGLIAAVHGIQAQTNYTWTGALSTAWNTAGNWLPSGIPGAADNITIVSGSNACVLNAPAVINNITVTSGVLDLGGNTLTVGGSNASFTTGTVQGGTLTVTGALNTVFGNGPLTMNCAVNITSAAVTLRNTNFQQTTNITKTGASNDASSGNNVFNAAVTFNNAGSGYLLMGNGNPDRFNAAATFNNTGSSNIYVAYNSVNNYFGGVTTFSNSPVANTLIYVSWYGSGTVFNGDIVVNSSGGQGVQFCGGNTTAGATLAAGKTISTGAGGFSAGTLLLRQFTQLGNAPLALSAAGTATLYFGPGSNFGGAVTATAPNIYPAATVFNGNADFTKTDGVSSNATPGGNTYNGTLTVNYNATVGSGYWSFGNGTADIYNGDVYSNNNSLDRIIFGHASANNQFNGNFIATQTGASAGTALTWNSSASCVMAAGKTVSFGAAGFSTGFFYLQGFTQNGNAPISLNGTGSSSIFVGAGASANPSVLGGDFTATAPDIYLRGGTFNGNVEITKTGGSSNHNNQYQNIFNGTCTIHQQSNSGYFMLGYNSHDIFSGDITVTSTGSGGIYLGWVNGTGTPTLAAGKTISVGAAGFSAGLLSLNKFTQLGNAPVVLNFTGATTLLQVAQGSAIGGSFTATAPRILLNGAVYAGDVTLTKTGATGEWSYGGNTFNGTTTINHLGAGYFGFANGAPDVYNGDLYVNNNSTERIIFANNPTGNLFNGNIILTQTGASVGTAFGWSSTTDETLAAGKTISIGAAGFDAGYLRIERFTQLGNAPVQLPLTGTASLTFGPDAVFGGNLTSSGASIYFNGGTFNGTVDAVKNGSSNDWSSGNNIFNAAVTMTNAGAGYWVFGGNNSDRFNAAATFNNTGSSSMYVAHNSSNNVFGGVTTFNNSPSANTQIYVSWYSAATVFTDNIIVSSTSGQGVQFCGGNTSATASLVPGKTISLGAPGFSAGVLLLKQFTQLGNTAQSLPLTGTANLTFGPSSAFGGDVIASSPTLYLNGCNFDGITSFTKNGTTGDWSQGGNIFNGRCSITNNGSSYLLLGASKPDIWNNDVTFTDAGSERLLPCWSSVGNQFNGNIFVNTDGSATGIQFCGGNTTATATLAATRSIQTGIIGLNAGYLILKQFTQLGSAPLNLTLNNTATYLQFGPGSTIGGDLTSNSPGLYFNGCTFNGLVTSVKNGASNDYSSGNNIFNASATLTNAGAGYLLFGGGNPDQFNSASTFNNTGSSSIYVAYNSSNNVFGGITTFNNSPSANTQIYVSWQSNGTNFNDNIVVTSTNGQGVLFCSGTSASAVLAANKTITTGPAGFSAGTLLLRKFTQTGATPQVLTLTGSGNLTFGPNSAFGGNINTVSPGLLFNGCRFDGTVTSLKNGGTNDASTGNNTFTGDFDLTNTGAGYMMMGNGSPDTWQSKAVFRNLSTGQHMYLAHNSTGNIFNGDVTFINQPASAGLWLYPNYYGSGTQFNGDITVSNLTGGGVYFGAGTGTATLAAGRKISAVAGNFTSGGLIFRNFTQQGGSTLQNIITTGTSYIQYGPSATFDGTVTSSSPGLFFNGTLFNGVLTATKTGTTNDQSQGGNIFNAPASFTNNGTGYLLMTTASPDAYNNDANFIKNGSGAVYPNYNNNSTYAGNIMVSASTPVTFGANSGTATFAGSGLQNISVTAGTPAPVFTRMVVANTGSGVTLNNTSVNVSGNLTLSSGLLHTSTSNQLTLLNGATTAAGTALSTSYVDGPMRYQKASSGLSTLNFPVGNGADCRPVVLTVNHSNGNLYTYQTQLYNASAGALGYTLPISVDKVSTVHYYTISRLNASNVNQPVTDLSGNQTIKIFFGANDVVTNGSTLTIVKNTYTNTTKWIDIGGTGGPAYNAGANLTGSIVSTSTPSPFNSFSTFALGNSSLGGNLLPVNLLYFNARAAIDGKVDLSWASTAEFNSSYFTVEKSRDGIGFTPLQKVFTKAVNGSSTTQLNYNTQDANPYNGNNYYRLQHTDRDGKTTYSAIKLVTVNRDETLSVYPNPSAGTVFISGLRAGERSVEIDWFDAGGRIILQQTAAVQNGRATTTAQIINGLYTLRIKYADGKTAVKNIMIMR